MTITVKDDDGLVHTYENILDYDFVDVSDVQNIAESVGVKLTDKHMKEIKRRCEKMERFPDYEDLSWIIKEIVNQ